MKINSNKDKPLTEEKTKKIMKNSKYREKINNDLNHIDNLINKLVLDRNKSDKIIGLAIGTEISCITTIITELIRLTEPNNSYSAIRIILLITSILIRNSNLKTNFYRDIDIELLNMIKEDIISENKWLNEQKINNSQKTLKY